MIIPITETEREKVNAENAKRIDALINPGILVFGNENQTTQDVPKYTQILKEHSVV